MPNVYSGVITNLFKVCQLTRLSALKQGQLQEWTEHCLTAVLKIRNQ